MNRNTTAAAIALALATLAAGPALADEAGTKTRAQVQAELLQAQRTGDIVDGEPAMKLKERFPGQYPAQAKTAGKTRAQVQAELFEARRTGTIVEGEPARKLNEQFPNSYPRKG